MRQQELARDSSRGSRTPGRVRDVAVVLVPVALVQPRDLAGYLVLLEALDRKRHVHSIAYRKTARKRGLPVVAVAEARLAALNPGVEAFVLRIQYEVDDAR